MARRGGKQEITFEANIDLASARVQLAELKAAITAAMKETASAVGGRDAQGRFTSGTLTETELNARANKITQLSIAYDKLAKAIERGNRAVIQESKQSTAALSDASNRRRILEKSVQEGVRESERVTKAANTEAIRMQKAYDTSLRATIKNLESLKIANDKAASSMANLTRKTDQQILTEKQRTQNAAHMASMSGMRLTNMNITGANKTQLMEGVLGEGEAWAGQIAVVKKLQQTELAQLKQYYTEYRTILRQQNYAVARDLETYLLEQGALKKEAGLLGGGAGGRGGGASGLLKAGIGPGGFRGAVTGGASMIGANLYGLAAVGGIAALVKSSVQAYTDVFASKNMLAGIIQTFGHFTGPNGKELQGGEKFVQSQMYSKQLYQDVKQKAIASPLTQQELMDMYTASMPFLARQGVNFKQGLDVSNDIAVLAKMMQLPVQQVKDDLRNLSTGQIKNAQSFQVMGFNRADVKHMAGLQGDDFMEFFNKKMAGYKEAMKNFADSFIPKWDNMITELYQTGARFGEKFAPAILKGVDHIMEAMDKWEKDGTLDRFADNITKVIDGLTTVVGFVLKNFESVTKMVELYLGVRIMNAFSTFLLTLQAKAAAAGIGGAGGGGTLGKIANMLPFVPFLWAGGTAVGGAIKDSWKTSENNAKTKARLTARDALDKYGEGMARKLAGRTTPYIAPGYGPEQSRTYKTGYYTEADLNEVISRRQNAMTGADIYAGSKGMKPPTVTGVPADDGKPKKGSNSGIGVTQITADVSNEERKIASIQEDIYALETRKYSLADNDYGGRQAIDAQIAQLEIQKAGVERDKAHKLAKQSLAYTSGGKVIGSDMEGVGKWRHSGDIATTNPVLLNALSNATKAGFAPFIGTAYTGHSKFVRADLTRSGRSDIESEHHKHNAVDISQINGIPLSSKKGLAIGNQMAAYLRSQGMHVIWQSKGHYDHIHASSPTWDTTSIGLKTGNIVTKDGNLIAGADKKYSNEVARIYAEQAKALAENQKQERERYKATLQSSADADSGFALDNLDDTMGRSELSSATKLAAIARAEKAELAAYKGNGDEAILGVSRIKEKYRKMRENLSQSDRASMNAYNQKLSEERGQKSLLGAQNSLALFGLTGNEYKIASIDQKISEKQSLMQKFPNWAPAFVPLIQALQKQKEAILKNTAAVIYSTDKRTQKNVTSAFGNMGFQNPSEAYKANYDDQISNIDHMIDTNDHMGLARIVLGHTPTSLSEGIKYGSMDIHELGAMAKYKASQGLSYSGRVQADYKTQLQEGGMAALQALASGQDVAGAFAGKYNNILGNDALQRLLGGRGSYTSLGVKGYGKWGIPILGNKFNKGAFSRDLISGGGGMAAQMLVGLLGQNNYSQEGSSIGGMLAGAGALSGMGLGAWAGPIGILAGGLLGSIFGKKKHQEEDPNIVAHRKRLEELLSSINNRLKPQEDVFRGIRGDVLFGSASRMYAGRTSLLGARNSLGVL